MKFFVIFISVKLLALPCGCCGHCLNSFPLPTEYWPLIYKLRQQQNNKIFIKTSCSRISGGFQAAIAAPSLSCFLSSDFKK
jgi:hypothetical protein